MENAKQFIILFGNTNMMKTDNNNEITKEDIQLAEKMWDARQKGLYYSSNKVTDLFNKLYNTKLANTSCGSCIRHRIEQIYAKIQEIRKLTTEQKDEERNTEGNRQT